MWWLESVVKQLDAINAERGDRFARFERQRLSGERDVAEKCDHGPNAGKPGPCPGPAQSETSDDDDGDKESAKPNKPGKPTPNADHPGASHLSAVKVKPSKRRAFDGKTPVATKVKLTKQETGRVGEAVVLAWLKSQGFDDARPMNTEATNFPVDMIEDHRPTEIKTGLVSNGRKAQQWRLTFSKESKKEKEAYKKMDATAREKWNSHKQQKIRERKKAVIKELEAKYPGVEIKPRTVTLAINPDTKTADLFVFSGFHDRLDWQSDQSKEAYVGSVKYGAAD